jgi:hypothetical protein
MATNGLAAWHGSATHPPRVGRNLTSAIMGQPVATFTNSATDTTRGGAYGVVGGPNSFKVTTTGALGFSVAAGRIVLPGTSATAQGAYVGYNDAAYTDSVDARDATNPRIDYIAYRVRDTDEDASTFEDDGIVKITGTPAATPSARPRRARAVSPCGKASRFVSWTRTPTSSTTARRGGTSTSRSPSGTVPGPARRT